MKIKVQRKDGSIETLDINGAIEMHAGTHQNRISSGTMDYFFNLDGTYDGWGRDVSSLNMHIDDAGVLISQIEDNRQIEEPGTPVAAEADDQDLVS